METGIGAFFGMTEGSGGDKKMGAPCTQGAPHWGCWQGWDYSASLP